ncbi:MAG: serine/threonine protein kinase [Hydrogenobacter thermophilus]|uniref:serine/threonine protein kinase n=1 Tax=Hydrogenobacter thermophilus TaxID=940 RepID=UPI001C77662B|nr:serine/threonine protein kinase [Hydrogenobacter thermophilus]QWK20654.1 MAG: serine/threonine protein kinase [Hydrogenobacter thermophilus]
MRFEELREHLNNLQLIGSGWRSYVYRSSLCGKDVAIKVAKEKGLEEAIRKEARILEKLKGIKNFPQIIVWGDDFLVYEFIDGIPFEKCNINPQQRVLILLKVLELAYLLDSMCISRDEFQRLDKNLLVDKDLEVYIIDFERGNISCKRKTNITQLMQLFVREGYMDLKKAIDLGRAYAKEAKKVVHELKNLLEKALRETS